MLTMFTIMTVGLGNFWGVLDFWKNHPILATIIFLLEWRYNKYRW